ncbi:hypothetical protein ALI22I_31175 [Saccharothrix sp. ALI-22-I]|uniref:DUF6292 family protein n=1 Tax=Saccharothrix sp. ALI-22-I TaxID=1933778 RepID=UPI00097C3C61|nr:DUF6292 family protein [Saccharothrix sp. ALI-22-I]ONI85176.1 hypothetical protein ALI22I_31175 [Saccharothrix sp. ALI-22-I]
MDPDPDLDFDDAPTRGLQRYVKAVAVELGLAGECTYADPGPPATAYLAVDGNLPSFPDRDLALQWDEEYGWAAAVETRSGEPPIVISYLGGDVLSTPAAVAAFLAALLHDAHPGDPRPIRLRAYGAADDFVDRLSTYPP